MGKATHVRMPRNEGGDDRDIFIIRYHRCPSAKQRAAETGDPDIDAVLFPIGLAGWEVPSEVTFEVPSAGACGACGALLRVWATWTSPQVVAMGGVEL